MKSNTIWRFAKPRLALLLIVALLLSMLPTTVRAASDEIWQNQGGISDKTDLFKKACEEYGQLADEEKAQLSPQMASYTYTDAEGRQVTLPIDPYAVLGSETNPIGISSEEELIAFGLLTTELTQGKYFILDKEGGVYDMSAHSMYPLFPQVASGSDMSTFASAFAGTFLGNGAEIQNANIVAGELDAHGTMTCLGFFGTVSGTATILDVTLSSPQITAGRGSKAAFLVADMRSDGTLNVRNVEVTGGVINITADEAAYAAGLAGSIRESATISLRNCSADFSVRYSGAGELSLETIVDLAVVTETDSTVARNGCEFSAAIDTRLNVVIFDSSGTVSLMTSYDGELIAMVAGKDYIFSGISGIATVHMTSDGSYELVLPAFESCKLVRPETESVEPGINWKEGFAVPLGDAESATVVSIDYAQETLSGLVPGFAYTITVNGTEESAVADANGNITIKDAWMGQTVAVRLASEDGSERDPSLAIPARPAAPDLSIDNATGSVTIPQGYRYNFSSDNYFDADWKDGNGSPITVTSGGTIYVYKAAVASGNDAAFKSAVQTLTSTLAETTYTISADPASIDFGRETEGYTAPGAKTVTITNAGNQSVSVTLPTSTNYAIAGGTGFESGTASLAAGGTAAFTVQPNTDLAAGNYSETIFISGASGSQSTNTVDIPVTFTVDAPAPPQSTIDMSEGSSSAATVTGGSGDSGSDVNAGSNANTGGSPYVTYTVRSGDTLWAISQRYGCTVAEIVAANSELIKNPNLIYPGWQMQIPQGGAAGTQTPETPDALLPAGQYLLYTVKRGDTLWAISQRYGCTVLEIISLNGELINNPDLIYAGWELRIPQD